MEHDQQTARDVAAVRARDEAMARAARLPLPGPLLAAFDPPACPTARALGLEIRAPVASDFIVLQRIESPLLKLGQEGLTIAEEEAAEIVWQFTTPVKRVRQELSKGRAAFRECAVEAIMDRLSPMEVSAIITEVRETYLAWLSTVVPYEEVEQGGEVNMDFPQPPAGTVPAGGSTMSPALQVSTA